MAIWLEGIHLLWKITNNLNFRKRRFFCHGLYRTSSFEWFALWLWLMLKIWMENKIGIINDQNQTKAGNVNFNYWFLFFFWFFFFFNITARALICEYLNNNIKHCFRREKYIKYKYKFLREWRQMIFDLWSKVSLIV